MVLFLALYGMAATVRSVFLMAAVTDVVKDISTEM